VRHKLGSDGDFFVSDRIGAILELEQSVESVFSSSGDEVFSFGVDASAVPIAVASDIC
jgi:hypothetical protein